MLRYELAPAHHCPGPGTASVRKATSGHSISLGPQRKVALMSSSEAKRNQSALRGHVARKELSPGSTVGWMENFGPLC